MPAALPDTWGNSSSAHPEIKNCVNSGIISGYYAGGITGYAKYSKISNCYNTGTVNGTTRAGGIAGQLQNECLAQYCYNSGALSGSATVADIVDFLYQSAKLTSCFYSGSKASGNSGSKYCGTVENCSQIITSEALLTALKGYDDTAWVADTENINNGYPILAWQADNATPPDTTPSLSITGAIAIYVQTGAGANQTTLTVQKNNVDDMDVSEVTWGIEKQGGGSAADIAILETVEDTTDSVVIKPVHGGVATVTASVTIDGQEEPVTASVDITVIPHITTAEIRNVSQPGTVAMGQTVEARVNIQSGGEYDYENYPHLSYQWQYRPSSGSTANIPGATAKTFTIPTDYDEWDYLHLEVRCGGAVVVSGTDTYQSIRSEAFGKLYRVAYDAAFSLPEDVKDSTALNLIESHTVGGVTAGITWTSGNTDVIANDGAVTQPGERQKQGDTDCHIYLRRG